MQNENSNLNKDKCDTIVESFYKEYSFRHKKELENQKAYTSENYNAKNSLYSGAHIKAIVKVELDYIQNLMDHLLNKIEADFPNIPLKDFQKKLGTVISQEYDRAIPVLEQFAKGILRGSNVVHYIKPVTDAKKNNLEILDARCKLHQVKKSINKFSIFISHAQEDASIAEVVKIQIDKVFGKGLQVFVSSIPGAIPPGSDWFDNIITNLIASDAFIVLITPISKLRHFVWFEIGFSWLRRHNQNCKMYALCLPPINLGDLPEPLCRLQATSLASEFETKAFFETIINQFKLGNLETLEFEKIKNSLPEYPTESIQKNKAEYSYTGPYANYSENALKQILIDILSEEKKIHRDPIRSNLSMIFNEKLIDFNQFDRQYKLPPGTSKKYLNEVAKDFNLEVKYEDDNTIRFEK